MRFVDVRCDGIARGGPRKGQTCNTLLHRISPDLVGYEETKCPRCNALRVWSYGAYLVGATG